MVVILCDICYKLGDIYARIPETNLNRGIKNMPHSDTEQKGTPADLESTEAKLTRALEKETDEYVKPLLASYIGNPKFTDTYSEEQLMALANRLGAGETFGSNILIKLLSEQNNQFREIFSTKRLFDLKELTPKSVITYQQMWDALDRLHHDNLDVEHLTIFLKRYSDLTKTDKAPFARLVRIKLLEFIGTNEPITFTPDELMSLKQSNEKIHALLIKIFDNYKPLEQLATYRDAVSQPKPATTPSPRTN